MAEAHMGPTELAEKANEYLEPDRTFDKSNVSHWLAEKYGAEDDRVIAIAQALGRDAIPALRAAGHNGVAAFAEKLRVNAAAALVEHELENIADDGYLDHLRRLAARGLIPPEEHDRRRAVYLDDKRRDIETIIPETYEAERARIEAGDNGNGSPNRTAL
jgi:hypothetical protein